MNEEKTCFIIAPIGEPESEVRRRSDVVLKHILTPPLERCGYAPVRADQIAEPGLISRQVLRHVIEDDLVIADLTGRNPNVYYELALRHVLRKPLIQVITEGESIPFDLVDMRTVKMNLHDLDRADQARDEIEKQIRQLEKDPTSYTTPISLSIELHQLERSTRPIDRTLSELFDAMATLRIAVGEIQDWTRERKPLDGRNRELLVEMGKLTELVDSLDLSQHDDSVSEQLASLSSRIRTIVRREMLMEDREHYVRS